MAPRKQIDDLQGLNTVSAPATSVQGAIAFAPRDNPLLDLAQNLKGINRRLGDYAEKQIAEENKAAIEEGKRIAMLDDAKSYKEYVEKGGDPMASPWVVYGYKQQKGRVLGQSYAAFVAEKKLNWEGSGSDDIDGKALVDALPKWRQEFLQQQGELDNVELTGFDAYAVPEEDNMLRQHIAEARQVATENMKTQVYNEFYNLFQTPGMTKDKLFAKFDEIYNRQDFIGLRKEVGPQLLQAVSDFAVESGDARIVDLVRSYSRKDAKTGQLIPVLKNTKATAILDKARNDAFKASVTLDNIRRSNEDNERQDNTRKTVTEAINKVAETGQAVDPFAIAREAAANGGDAAATLSAVSSVNNILKNKKNEWTDRLVTDIYSEIMQTGPTKTYAEYVKDISGAGGDRGDLEAFAQTWNQHVQNGKSIFAQYPELETRLFQMNSGKNEAEAAINTRQMAQAIRNATARKVPKENLPTEVKKELDELRRLQKEINQQFAPVPQSNLDQNGVPLPPGGIKEPAKSQTSALQLQPVASMPEIMAVRGKPAEVVNRLLTTKPLMSPALFTVAMKSITEGTNTPEKQALLRVMATVGIDTSNPRAALAEYLKRGQKKFYATAQSQQPQKK